MNMKTLACLTASLAATAALADIEVQVGVTEVTSTNKNTIVAVPYTDFSSGNITVSNIVKTANLQEDDLCYVMRTDGSNLYDAWKLCKVGDVLQWQEIYQVSMTGGAPVVVKSPSPCTTTLAAGSALWIVRDGDSRDYTKPFYLWGKYSDTVPTSTVTSSADGTWNMVANAGLKAMTVSELISALGDDKWQFGDQIVLPVNGTEFGFMKMNSRWTDATLQSTTKIQPGMGCWIFKKGEGKGGTIQWPQTAD